MKASELRMLILNEYKNDMNIIKDILENKKILHNILHVNKNDIVKSTEHFKELIKFRKKYNPKLIKRKNVKKLLDNKTWYYGGFTKKKIPILICKVGNIDVENYTDIEIVVQLIAYIMEKSYKYGNLFIIYDFENTELKVGPKILKTI